MFKSTNHFFKKVYQNIVTEIEIDNYIETITSNYNLEKLKILGFDIERFIREQIEKLEEEITEEIIENRIATQKTFGFEIPYKMEPNVDYMYAEAYSLPLDGIPQYDEVLDTEKLCYPRRLGTIRQLKQKIESLISIKTQELESIEQNGNQKYTKEVKSGNTETLPETEPKNKSMLLNGSPVNLVERFKMADKVFKIDSILRDLNIGDLEKYQFLAYILQCHPDNARNLMNGTYKSRSRDLTSYFNSLHLKE